MGSAEPGLSVAATTSVLTSARPSSKGSDAGSEHPLLCLQTSLYETLSNSALARELTAGEVDACSRTGALNRVASGGQGCVMRSAEQPTLAVKLSIVHTKDWLPVSVRTCNEHNIGSLNHPGLVGPTSTAVSKDPRLFKLVDHRCTPDVNAFVMVQTMPFVTGGTLRNALTKVCRANRQRLAIGLLKQTLSPLTALHNHTLVHHDLKPDNMMLSAPLSYLVRRGTGSGVCLVDFGYANETGHVHPGIGCTYGFAPPEVLRGGQVVSNPAIDVYAMGCIAYQILDGRRKPYLSGAECRNWQLSWQDKAALIAKRDVVWRKYVQRRTSVYLRWLVERMVAKDANKRPTLAQVERAVMKIEDILKKEKAKPCITFAARLHSSAFQGKRPSLKTGSLAASVSSGEVDQSTSQHLSCGAYLSPSLRAEAYGKGPSWGMAADSSSSSGRREALLRVLDPDSEDPEYGVYNTCGQMIEDHRLYTFDPAEYQLGWSDGMKERSSSNGNGSSQQQQWWQVPGLSYEEPSTKSEVSQDHHLYTFDPAECQLGWTGNIEEHSSSSSHSSSDSQQQEWWQVPGLSYEGPTISGEVAEDHRLYTFDPAECPLGWSGDIEVHSSGSSSSSSSSSTSVNRQQEWWQMLDLCYEGPTTCGEMEDHRQYTFDPAEYQLGWTDNSEEHSSSSNSSSHSQQQEWWQMPGLSYEGPTTSGEVAEDHCLYTFDPAKCPLGWSGDIKVHSSGSSSGSDSQELDWWRVLDLSYEGPTTNGEMEHHRQYTFDPAEYQLGWTDNSEQHSSSSKPESVGQVPDLLMSYERGNVIGEVPEDNQYTFDPSECHLGWTGDMEEASIGCTGSSNSSCSSGMGSGCSSEYSEAFPEFRQGDAQGQGDAPAMALCCMAASLQPLREVSSVSISQGKEAQITQMQAQALQTLTILKAAWQARLAAAAAALYCTNSTRRSGVAMILCFASMLQ